MIKMSLSKTTSSKDRGNLSINFTGSTEEIDNLFEIYSELNKQLNKQQYDALIKRLNNAE